MSNTAAGTLWFDSQCKGAMAMGVLSDELLRFRPDTIVDNDRGFLHVEYREVCTPTGLTTRAFLIDPAVHGMAAELHPRRDVSAAA